MPILRSTSHTDAPLPTGLRAVTDTRWRDKLRGTLFQRFLLDG